MKDLRVSFPKPCSEQWDAMRSEGCDRFCDRCEKTIHDLSQLTLEEAEELARSRDDFCVRVLVGPGGVVQLKRSDARSARRMVATIGASVGILAASGQAAHVEPTKTGAIKGAVVGSCGFAGSIIATAADGSVYRAKIGMNGRYKVKRLPAGSYEVKLENAEPEAPPEENAGPETPLKTPNRSQVIVEAGRTSVSNIIDPNGCIIVGMLEVEDGNG